MVCKMDVTYSRIVIETLVPHLFVHGPVESCASNK